MRKILIITSIIFVYHLSFSQNLDLIVTEAGDSIACKIDSITDSQIYLQIKTHHSKTWVHSVNDLNKISSYEYNVIDENMYIFKTGTSVIDRKTKNLVQYKYVKNKYSHKDYVPGENDKYDIGLAGVLSLIPGIGLIYTGEPSKALGYVGGMAGSFLVMGAGFAVAYQGGSSGYFLFFTGVGGMVFFYIANIVSAVKVAKVKNLAIRDKTVSFNFSPQIEIKNQLTPTNTFGLKVSLNF